MLYILCAVIGAIALTVITTAYHWLFWPTLLGDGQYFFVWAMTLFGGALLGAATKDAFAPPRETAKETGTAIFTMVGMAALPLGFGLRFDNLLLFLPSLCWMLALFIRGIFLLVPRQTHP